MRCRSSLVSLTWCVRAPDRVTARQRKSRPTHAPGPPTIERLGVAATPSVCFTEDMRRLFCLLALTACDDAASPSIVVDAGLLDAAPLDGAPLDGSATDAALSDAAASVDGALSDAALPDATPPDAALPDATVPDATVPDAYPHPPETLRFNAVQAKGTHNSYHVEPERPIHPSHRYTQPPLDAQLAEHGVRQFELDVHARVEGGFNVLHLPVIDPETTCLALEDCLATTLAWSRAHPTHFPILIWIEPKDELSAPANGHQVNSVAVMPTLDPAILSVVPRRHIFTPSDLRGDFASERDAIMNAGWPTLDQMRGKLVFAMLDGGRHRDSYLAGTDDGRIIFVDPDSPEDPHAAIFKINNGSSAEARARVEEGFIVTSNVDSADDTPENNARRRAEALANGVQFLSSDFPAPLDANDMNWLMIPEGNPVRCNPVTAPEACTAMALEDL